MEKKYVIFLNGEYKYSQEFMDKLVSENAVCFCADGGANFAFKYGKMPEVIIGDLDSIEKGVLEHYEKKNVLMKKFPKDKDFTDFELILEEISKIEKNRNYLKKIFVVGGLGKRIDMTLSNLFLMEKHKNLVFLEENEEIFYAEKPFALENKKGYGFSIIPISEKVEKLTLKGFKFETDKIDVKRESSRLVSNVICQNEANVEFAKGKLIIILNIEQ
ncbi:thiamine diphosphokinase [Leptotrichia buccalis]|uniref:Thiamine diphosphokinase n=1 Tax=Leptotrichia buccalis (strain ATCC 14201 / DSM 1135 / JCM 12969 / NCTC 10249 / C-1013-b) TaxID=523794 RepID=C7NDQ9_LEPBD|nr:thiamine diphosphokinase [Leptotrichia buccalis]ACV40023.1 thiamine pyrophosphokinase [Leptotrichia buccalis C-1013-b]